MIVLCPNLDDGFSFQNIFLVNWNVECQGFLENTLQGFLWPGQTFHNPPDQPVQLSDQASEQEYVMRAVPIYLQDSINGDLSLQNLR